MKVLVFYVLYMALVLGVFVAAVKGTKSVAPTPPKAPEPTLEIVDPGSIVRLVDHTTGRTFCSGTVISSKYVLTAGHCVVSASLFGVALRQEDIEIRRNDNIDIKVAGKAVYATTQLDQGLIKGDFGSLDSRAYISDVHGILDEKHKGKTFTTCGYPMGGDLFCAPFNYENDFQFAWAGTGNLIPGMSGGPAMNDRGVVIGVNVAVEGNQSIISPIYNIAKELTP